MRALPPAVGIFARGLSLGVVLTVEGDRPAYEGSASAVAALLPELCAHREAILEALHDEVAPARMLAHAEGALRALPDGREIWRGEAGCAMPVEDDATPCDAAATPRGSSLANPLCGPARRATLLAPGAGAGVWGGRCAEVRCDRRGQCSLRIAVVVDVAVPSRLALPPAAAVVGTCRRPHQNNTDPRPGTQAPHL